MLGGRKLQISFFKQEFKMRRFWYHILMSSINDYFKQKINFMRFIPLIIPSHHLPHLFWFSQQFLLSYNPQKYYSERVNPKNDERWEKKDVCFFFIALREQEISR